MAIPISLTSAGGAQPAGLQFSLSYNSDITAVAVTIGNAGSGAQKSLSCSSNTCLIYGVNQTAIASGTVATATFQVAAQPSTSNIPIQLIGVVAVDANTNAIPATGTPGTVTVVPLPVMTGLSCLAGTLLTPASTTCTLSLSSAAPAGGISIALVSNNPSLSIPANVTVAAGQITASFNATAAAVSGNQTATVTASFGGSTVNTTISLQAPVQLTGLACSPSTLALNATGACTVTLSKAVASAVVVALSSSSAAISLPTSVTIPAGQSSATFPVTSGTISGSQAAVITASYNGTSQTATVVVSAPVLSAVSVTPSGSAGTSQTFSFVFSDSQSAANFSAGAFLIGPSLAYPNTCLFVYDRTAGTIQLESDNASSATEKPVASATILQNSQCAIGATTVATAGLATTITAAITFTAAFSGAKNIYMYGADTGGVINTGWIQKGTYTVVSTTPPTPAAISATPNAGSGSSQTFSFVFSDTQSAANLSAAAILFAPSVTYTNACLVVYDHTQGTIQLETDSATGANQKPITSAGVLQNSQCTIGATSVTTSGLTNTLTIAITFSGAFSGVKNIYMYGSDGGAGTNTGWVQEGTYAVTAASTPVLTAVSATPNGGVGASQTFSFTFSDSQSGANLSAAAFLIAPSLAYPNSCLVVYDRTQGTVQLEWDNVAGADEKPVSSTTVLQNSQCAIGAVSVTTTGPVNTISIGITFNSAFSGLQNIYMYGADTDGTINTGWVNMGTWKP